MKRFFKWLAKLVGPPKFDGIDCDSDDVHYPDTVLRRKYTSRPIGSITSVQHDRMRTFYDHFGGR